MTVPTRPWGSDEFSFIDKHIGHQLKDCRTAFRMRPAKLAARLKLPEELLVKYEAGAVPIPATDLYEVAKILGVPIGYFFDGLDRRFGTVANGVGRPQEKISS